jgi:hypothetical protein
VLIPLNLTYREGLLASERCETLFNKPWHIQYGGARDDIARRWAQHICLIVHMDATSRFSHTSVKYLVCQTLTNKQAVSEPCVSNPSLYLYLPACLKPPPPSHPPDHSSTVTLITHPITNPVSKAASIRALQRDYPLSHIPPPPPQGGRQ